MSEYIKQENPMEEVVYCKYCGHRNKAADTSETAYCKWLGITMPKDGFCSYGSKEEGG